MARQVLPIAGAVVGSMFGAPQLGFAIGSIIGNVVDPVNIKGPSIGEARVQTSQEGAYRPLVMGTGCVSGNIIHRGPRILRTKKQRGGKGGPTTTTEHIFRTFAIRIAEGPIAGLLRIWESEKLVYDNRPESTIVEESIEYAKRFRFYDGGETQLPDPALEAYMGSGNVNAYRGTCYIVFPDFELTDYSDTIPQYRFEIATETTEEPIDRLPERFPFTDSWSGGIEGVNRYTSVSEDIGPIGLITVSTSFTGTLDLSAPVRAQVVYASGAVIYDSGWLGDPSLQSALDELVLSSAYPGMTGVISYLAPGDSITQEIYPTMPVRLRFYAARPVGAPIEFSIRSVVRAPRPESIPAGARPYPVPGTLIGDDGVIVAAPWGPDSIGEAGSPAALAGIVARLHQRVSAAPPYVVGLADEIDGIVFADGYSAADAIRSLMPIYMFDAYEADVGSGYRINYRKRGGPVVQTLTVNDLVEDPEESVREDSLERPRVLHLAFQNPTIGYAAAKASPRRNSPDVKVVGEVSTSVPVTFSDPDEAWRRADVMLKVMWSEVAGKQELSVSESLIDLVPTDPVGVFLRGQVRRMRIERIEYAAGILKCELKADRQSAFTSNLTGVPLPAPEPPPPSIAGATIGMQLDIPALIDTNDRLLYYDAGVGTLPAWGGYQLQRSINSGSSFTDVHDVRWTSAAVIGELLAVVSDASQHYTDTTNTVRVKLYRDDDELESLTDQQFLSEGGSFALSWMDGGVRKWEILQYRDANQEVDGSWTLSHLLRGRLDTTTAAHAAGAYFVLLDTVTSVDAVSSMIGQDLTHRSVSFGTSPESATPNTMVYVGRSQQEWPVAHLFLSLDGSTLTARAVPRHRFGTEDNPVRSANWSGYRWTATDGTQSVSLDGLSDVQAFDVSGWSDPITVTVAQINRITGAGPIVTEVIE